MRYQLVSVVFLFLSVMASAQYEDFDGLHSSGMIDQSLLLSSREKYEKEILEGDFTSRSKEEVDAMKDFYIRSHYLMDQNVANGTLLINDETGIYLQKLLDRILVNDPELRSRISIYTARSPFVNAYATDQGILMVNLGLLSKVRNEAELAFILSHEIVHFAKAHNISLVLEAVSIEKEVEYMGRGHASEKLFRKHAYNRALETEADRLGLERFVNLGYNPTHAYGAFDALDSSTFPYTFRSVDLYSFTPETFYYKDSISVLIPEDVVLEEDEELTTHPGTEERKKAVLDYFESEIPDSGFTYLLSEEEFKHVQNLARLELTRYLNTEGYYVTGFYHAYCMLQDMPSNDYIQKAFVESLYKLTKAYVDGAYLDNFSINDQGIEDQVADIFRRLKNSELLVLAMHNAFQSHLEFPEEPYFRDVFIDLMSDVIEDRGYEIKDTTVSFTSTREFQGKTYLTDMASDSTWLSLYEVAKEIYFQNEDDAMNFHEARIRRKQVEAALRKGVEIDIDSILVFNPFYYHADATSNDFLDYFTSEERQQFFEQSIKDFAADFNKSYTLFELHDLSPEQTDKLNDLTLISDWLVDREVIPGNHSVSVFDSYMDSISTKYDANYLLTIGMYTEKSPSWVFFSHSVLFMVLNPLAYPAIVFNSLRPHYNTYFVYSLIDVSDREVIFAEQRKIKNVKNKDQMIKQHLYDFFSSISH
ncbi:MAG: M48 family metallopeptidase [Flavobacteriales bacterium]|nr:M48 family metallopeptidase [Flavobacteriales bacterium]